MSIKIMSQIWADSQQSEGTLLVALALADFADDEGYCWPKIDTIAIKARLKPRMVQYAIKKLVDAGELEKVYDPAHRKSNTFHFIDRKDNVATGVQSMQGEVPCAPGVQLSAPLSIYESSVESPLQPAAVCAVIPSKPPRPRNVLFDALVEAEGINPAELGPLAGGRIARALKEIKAACPEVTPEEIKRRAWVCKRTWPNVTFTSNSLAINWSKFGAPLSGQHPQEPNYREV